VRVEELRPDHYRHDACEEERHQRGDHVGLADDLVVGRRQPIDDPTRSLVMAVIGVTVGGIGMVTVGSTEFFGSDDFRAFNGCRHADAFCLGVAEDATEGPALAGVVLVLGGGMLPAPEGDPCSV
jgi:hypothetical protein